MADTLMSWAKDTQNKKYVILIILLILLIIILTFYPFGKNSDGNTPQQTVTPAARTAESADYEEKLERKLKNMLSKMEGVGPVDVMVTLGSTREKVVASNVKLHEQQTEEKDQAGGTRTTKETQSDTNVVLQKSNVPYITKENMPEIKGVLIVAQGADSSEIKMQIADAVSKALDVPIHKISVEKKKN